MTISHFDALERDAEMQLGPNREILGPSSFLAFLGLGGKVKTQVISEDIIRRRDDAAPVHASISPQLDTLVVISQHELKIRSARDKFKSVKASWKCTFISRHVWVHGFCVD